jgi:hypothetical protein
MSIISILNQLKKNPTARDVYFPQGIKNKHDHKQEEFEKQFFGGIRLKNGTFKTTYSHRFDDLNLAVNNMLPKNQELQLMDVAVSSGISTVEWSESLKVAGIPHKIVAGDLTVKTSLISIGRFWRVLVDRTGFPLQFDIFGIALPSSDEGIFRVPLFILRKTFAMLLSLNKDMKKHLRGEECIHPETKCYSIYHQIDLISTRLKENSAIEIIEDDILLNTDSKLQKRFHVIRAANIVQRGYFDDGAIIRVLYNLRNRLRIGGLLIVCRTNKAGVNNGIILKLNEWNRFETVETIGTGSEIQDLVHELPC